MTKQNFPINDSKASIANDELNVLEFWQKHNIFQKTIDQRSSDYEYKFFDGPPFATGLPHYGHILAGTIKDAIPRYWTMKGYKVNRKWGWDCHGVPVEFQVEKENQIGGKPGIEKMGVGKFNELCRSVVLRCASQWKETVARMGRFVDFEDDYKTMDPEFMESVWWVFSELHKKGLIYEGDKVVSYSPKLGSPLSNFEANLNYADIDDPAVTVAFELDIESAQRLEVPSNTSVLSWTTTPWTLPSNLALCVNPSLDYVLVEVDYLKFKDGSESRKYPAPHPEKESEQYKIFIEADRISKRFIVAEKLVDKIFGASEAVQAPVPAKKFKGADLVGLKYKPIFPFFKGQDNAHQIFGDDFVAEDSGTGVVHMAPTGEDDARILQAHDIKLWYPFTDNCYFDFSDVEHTPASKELAAELSGKYFRYDPEVDEATKEDNANIWVIEKLKASGHLFKREQIRHSYPHCWRTDCALIYRGINTWFVNVRKIKETMLEQNQNINWIPDHLKDGRFGKILEGAPDWAISRNRFWGTPIPVWRCDKTGEVQVVSSRAELEKLCGQKVDDLHKHFVDDLTWPSPFAKDGTMRRIEEVLDCWFESGSMPYGSVHYPFNADENGVDFQSADFIAEGLDQTRGWFYTLHVLGCALFGKNIYKNVITNGIVLAEDGQKMSKSKKNYPDPNLVFDKYGADAMRYYLLSSPVVRGENFRFAEYGVEEVLKSVILPLKSAYNFFSTYANIDGWRPTEFVFLRHGEGEHNVTSTYSGLTKNDHKLTTQGIQDIKDISKTIGKPDVLVSSPLLRTRQTADILKNETQYQGEVLIDERVRECNFGNLEGQQYIDFRERLKNPTSESLESITERTKSFVQEYAEQQRGKKIVVASHGAVVRMARALGVNIHDSDNPFQVYGAQPGKFVQLFIPPLTNNELDRWIISELQTLVSQYCEHFEAYDLEGALKHIAPFVDKLNNWYLRRSRRRFWASGLEADKVSAYETLHYVLFTLSKVMAPVCPFFAEKMYQDLGGAGSVHLEFMPQPYADRVEKDLEVRVGLAREIVGLAAGIRARKKIKLRQPLQKLRLSTTVAADLDLEVIRAEANVKEIEVLNEEQVREFATKIVKVNARLVGKKFGKKVQQLIQAGKSGEFKELSDGTIEIAGEKLLPGEFDVVFLTTEGVDADSLASGTVVLLDTTISANLAIEGMARELIRKIQDMRKENDFEVSDRIKVFYSTESDLIHKAFSVWGEKIQAEVLAVEIADSAGYENMEIDGEKFSLTLEKVK